MNERDLIYEKYAKIQKKVFLVFLIAYLPLLSYFLIKNGMENKSYENALIYETGPEFREGIDIDEGNFFAYGEIKTNSPIKFSAEVWDKDYEDLVYLREDTYEYKLHSNVVTKTDSNGHTTVETEETHSWDRVDSNEQWTDNITFMDIPIDFHCLDGLSIGYTGEKYVTENKRIKYYTLENNSYGTLKGSIENGSIKEAFFYKGLDVNTAVQNSKTEWYIVLIGFSCVWIIVTGVSQAITYGILEKQREKEFKACRDRNIANKRNH